MDQIARNPQQLGAALRRRRKALELSQRHLSDRTALRQATLSDLETGEGDPKLSTLMAALAALDLELVVRPRTKGGAADLFLPS
mgnify:CR=1 FL=1